MTLLTDKGIDQTRLTSIRTTDNSKTGNTVFCLVTTLLRQHLQHLIEQITRTTTRSSTDRIRITQSEFIKLILVIQILTVISLVGYKDHRQFRTTQDLGNIHIPSRHTIADVTQEENQICFFCGNNHLLSDFLLKYIIRVHHPAAGIDDRELLAIPFTFAVLAVTSCTSLTADDRLARLRQTIEQGRLSHIRASYNGYQISHNYTPLLLLSSTPSLLSYSGLYPK